MLNKVSPFLIEELGKIVEKGFILKISEGDAYMSGDGAIWSVLFLSLLVLNILAITLYKKEKMPLWGSGLIIGILGPIIAFISGSVFVKVDHSMGGDGVGAAFGAAFIGIVIVSNGILYFIIGIISVIKNLIRQRNLNQ
ncbi:ABC transporter permease [Peribacillus frigoritolerans]|uniref:ABC transporter permease n=1 Tax=Peribacillus frigoritolerans TaxID=450367 RepID=UPI00257122FD|nr:ABC transporter permease [Peribacillus frigoritolerans]